MKSETLLTALNSSPASRWRDAALYALRSDDLTFAGQSDSKATAMADELADTYRVRLEHTRKHKIDAVGIEELLDVLAARPAGSRLRVTPFLSSKAAVHAFWDEGGTLIGCVTVNRNGIDSGEKSFNIAMGR